MTAAERLASLAGATGTAATLLALIGAGATAGACLVEYSGLATGTAAEHLLADVAVTSPSAAFGAGLYRVSPRRQRGFQRLRPMPAPAVRRRDDTLALMLTGAL